MDKKAKNPVVLENIYKRFGSNEVLKGVSLEIQKGKVTVIIGKSGEGKSVLLKHIIGLLEPDKGNIYFDGMLLKNMTRKELKTFRKRISYMFQGNALFDSMTVFENIALPLYENNEKKDIIEKSVKKRIEQLELVGSENNYPSELSGGMQKRVALARALVNEPEIVLFDEPTTGLDPIRKNYVHEMISDYQKKFGFTAVLVSHEIPEVFKFADEIIMLDEGKVVFTGTKEELENSNSIHIKNFIEGRSE